MAILGLATSGPDARVGLQGPDDRVWEGPTLGRTSRGRDLLPAVRDLLAQAGSNLEALTGVVVDRGPGSFTGVRVGVTCAKTLAYALGIPVAGVLSLDLLAHAAAHPGSVTAVRDAGRGTLYVCQYGARAQGRPVCVAPARQPAETLRSLGDTTFVGEDAEALAARHGLAPAHDVALSMESLFALGVPALDDAVSAHGLAPFYLQASAPERLRRGEI